MAVNAGEILTLEEVAEFLRCHPNTVYRLCKAGKIPVFKLGSDWRFRRDELDRWIEARQLRVK